jgi:hypothetical protein
MRYTLWSRGRLVGRTDLDIHTVTPTMRQGFIEPTTEGMALLADATAVWRALGEMKRGTRARGDTGANDRDLFQSAVDRRENLDFELRDETGTVFDCDFIRITDLFDLERVTAEMTDTEEEEEAAFQIRLSGLSGKARDEALAGREETNAEIEELMDEMMAEGDEDMMFGSASPPPDTDPRWDTMQYLLQLYLKDTEGKESM